MLGRKASEETKAKLSASHKGKRISEEAKKKQRATMLGRILSPEARSKISASRKGKKASDETKAKLSAARKGKKLKFSMIQVSEIKEKYASGKLSQDAISKEYGVKQTTVSRIVTGKYEKNFR